MTTIARRLALAAPLALAGCGLAQTSPFAVLNGYDPGMVYYAARDAGMPTVIHGNPFAMPKPAADAAIRDVLELPAWAQRAAFVDTAPARAGRGYRVVLVFDAATPGVPEICDNVAAIPLVAAAQGGRVGPVRVNAAFCSNDRALSEIASHGTAAGPGDPRFKALMDQTLDALLPRENFDVRNNSRCVPPDC